MKPDQNSTTVIHPDVKRLVIYGKEVCPNGKIRDHWEDDFHLHENQIQVSSLEGCPRVVNNRFRVIYQKHLNSLNGSPERAKYVSVWNCSKLQDLTGITTDCNSYSIYHNKRLLSLTGIPTHQEIDLYVTNNPKLSFTACHFSSIKSLHWTDNKDDNLYDFHRHFPKITHGLMISGHIKSHVLSVLLVEGLKEIILYGKLNPMVAIINKHLPNTTGKKGMLSGVRLS